MDDLKLSHKDSFEVTSLSAYLTNIYGGLKVECVKVQNYLGEDLYYSDKGVVKVSMVKYLNNFIHNFP